MKKLVLAVALVVAFAAPAMAQDFPQGYNQNSINFDQVISPCWAPACRRVSPPTIIDGIMGAPSSLANSTFRRDRRLT